MPDSVFESRGLMELFTTYTASPDSIGAHLAQVCARNTEQDPMLVVTGTDLALYPGGGAAPIIEPYRLASRGFRELAGISHLGPALAALVKMRELEPDGLWRADAVRLLRACTAARAATSVRLWRDELAVVAFAGREESIAAMIKYSCRLAERFLRQALDDPGHLTMAAVREEFLEGPAEALPVPFNKVMIATFFLTGLDIAHRLIAWLDGVDIPWERAMVIFAGQVGRPTAALTRESHSIAGVVQAASRGRLASEQVFIAPHAPVFPPFDPASGDVSAAAALEQTYRQLWAVLSVTSELGGQMFEGYPRFEPLSAEMVSLGPDSASVHEKPAVTGPDDWYAMITRLRVVMEDPRQLLSGAVTDCASSQLLAVANDPAAVTIPGLDGEQYPHSGGTAP